MERWVAAAAAMVCAALAAASDGDRATLRRETLTRLHAGDDSAADAALDAYLATHPDDGLMLYHAACLDARHGHAEEAQTHLLDAVKVGYFDFSRMRRDPDLVSIRESSTFRAIMNARAVAESILPQRRITQWQERFGADAYRAVVDEASLLQYVTPLDERDLNTLRERIDVQAAILAELLFPRPRSESVMIALLRDRDHAAVLPHDRVHGRYVHYDRELVVADTGQSMQHELVHLFHHADMDTLGQEHPYWIQEGMATLFEAFEIGDDGSVRFLQNDRSDMATVRAKRDKFVPWTRFFALDRAAFLIAPVENYAQARSIFEFLAERGHLSAWYRTYTNHYDDDPSGETAVSLVFADSIDAIETRWRTWVSARTPGDTALIRTAIAPDVLVEIRRREREHVMTAEEAREAALVQGLYDDARELYEHGRYAEAVASFETVIERRPDMAPAHYDLGLALVRLGDLEAARTTLSSLTELDPSLASLLENLVR